MSIEKVTLQTINNRYSALSESTCCLSCGGAIDYCEVKPGNTCLDLGSGRGNDVLRLAEMTGTTGKVYGIDVSDGMLKKARKNAEKFNVTNTEFIKSVLEEIPLEDESIDIIISNCTINHAEEKEKVWKEVNRVLKKDGYFVVSDIYSTEPVPEQYRSDPQAIAECWAGADTKEAYLQTLQKAGFEGVEILEQSTPYPKGEIEVASWTLKGVKK